MKRVKEDCAEHVGEGYGVSHTQNGQRFMTYIGNNLKDL